jgi:hypothetical protein
MATKREKDRRKRDVRDYTGPAGRSLCGIRTAEERNEGERILDRVGWRRRGGEEGEQ